MAVYFVQGKLGAGKGIISVSRIQDYLLRGRIVATNMDLQLEHLVSPFVKDCQVFRVPDKPRLIDLENLPIANDSYDEKNNGLLCLDECATWFNSRNWNDKTRKGIIDWLIHARKYGWDVIIQIQDVSAVDSQARELLMEHTVTCKRTDRMNIPGLGTLFKMLTGSKMTMPKAHSASIEYTGSNIVVDRWFTRGCHLYNAYDTKQIFSPEYLSEDEESGVSGVYALLPPYFEHGRKMVKKDKDYIVRLSKIYFRKLEKSLYVFGGALAAFVIVGIVSLVMYEKPTVMVVADVVDGLEEKRNQPRYHKLYIVSESHITSSKGSGVRVIDDSIQVTDGNDVFRIRDLMSVGYRYKRYAACYHELTDLGGNVIPVYCDKTDDPV